MDNVEILLNQNSSSSEKGARKGIMKTIAGEFALYYRNLEKVKTEYKPLPAIPQAPDKSK